MQLWQGESGRCTVITLETIAKIIDLFMADRRVMEHDTATEFDNIKQIRRGKLTRGVLFHQDNVPAHRSTEAIAATQKCGFKLVEDPPYSPGVAPSSRKYKIEIGGHHFAKYNYVILTVDPLSEGPKWLYDTRLSMLMYVEK